MLYEEAILVGKIFDNFHSLLFGFPTAIGIHADRAVGALAYDVDHLFIVVESEFYLYHLIVIGFLNLLLHHFGSVDADGKR